MLLGSMLLSIRKDRLACTVLLVCLNFQVIVCGSTRLIEYRGEWGSGTVWTVQLACTVDLAQSYDPSTTGFYIKLNLEPQATRDITVYYPFDTKGISVFDQGNEKVYLIPTRDNFWEWGGTKTYSLKVKFVNEEKKSGNWPNGTCSGPYPLDMMTDPPTPTKQTQSPTKTPDPPTLKTTIQKTQPPTKTPDPPTLKTTVKKTQSPTEIPDAPTLRTTIKKTQTPTKTPDSGTTAQDDGETGRCRPDCQPPDCSCPRYSYPMETREIPQMVYFGFDDAVNVMMASLYDQLFTPDRKNPNGCTMKFTLFICDEYTDYGRVKGFYERGNEIAVHSVTHSAIDNDEILRREAKQQKENLVNKAGVPSEEIVGWRSPFLKTAGNNQPKILNELGYDYDISLTYVKSSLSAKKPWPFTIENGWPYSCGVRPCPHGAREPGFWEVPVVSMMDHEKRYPCSFVDGCAIRANNEHEAFEYLWNNFESHYNTTRTPFGLNMHAAWFYTKHNLEGMKKFLTELQKLPDVYVITVKQVLDWLKNPTPVSEISRMTSWGCPNAVWPDQASAKTSSTKQRQTIRAKPTPTTSTASTTTTTTTTTTTKRPPTTTKKAPKTQWGQRQMRWRRPSRLRKRLPWWKRRQNKSRRRPTTTTNSTTTTTTSTTTKTTTKPTTTTTSTEKPTTTSTTRRTASTKATTTTMKHITNIQANSKTQIEKEVISAKNDATTIAPWFKAWFNSPTTIIPPFVRTDWWSLWGAPVDQGMKMTTCKQDVNCKLPNCFCQGQTIPSGLSLSETPQMILITIDGSVNPSVYRRYREIFRSRRNPNGCDARGTVFSTANGSYRYFLQRVRSLGAEVAMRGLHEHHFETAKHLEEEIIEQKKSLRRSGITEVMGWKTPEFKSLGDDQFKILERHGFLYDSTLAMNLPRGTSNNLWPFTLDFGYNGECAIPVCPKGSFPGLWEIPNNALKDYRGLFECTYTDGCMFNPPTANDTVNFLMNNLMFNYKTNKAPFGIHLRQTWFSHPAYKSNIKGLKKFLDEVQKLNDVYLVAAVDIIDWIKNPTPLSQITNSIPWSCSRRK